ncbi:MAG: hypothetical protein FWC19_04635 [Treponema sp.]|jgi:hypothetical protein|nr:hypothetical protein [Treponema sp.]MCL2272077.1 hypothetical protein [Treponema sp.]
MKKFMLLGIIALAVIMVSFTGCMTGSSIGGTADAHGLFSQAGAASVGGMEIASYTVWFGLVDSGYTEYAAIVKDAEAAGRKITSITKFYFVFTRTTAYAE